MSDSPSARPNTLDRRRVLQGAAWTAPVVALAAVAPGASASPCTLQYPGSVRFQATTGANPQAANYVRGAGNSTTAGSASVSLVGAPAQVTPFNVTFESTALTAGYTRAGTNFALTTPTVAGPNPGTQARFTIQQTSPAGATTGNIGQTVTVNFGRPVRNLQFDILGFTRSQATYSDAAVLTGGTFTVGTRGSQVSGLGTAASPWVTNAENANQGQTSAANTVAGVTFAGPVSSIQLRYYSSVGTGQSQALFLSNMTFTASCS